MARQLVGLARHSAIYGVGGLIARVLAVVLLPLYTRYLTREDYGAIGTLIALTSVLAVLLRLGTQSAFFRYYFDSKEREDKLVVVRTAFWYTMTAATAISVTALWVDAAYQGALPAVPSLASANRGDYLPPGSIGSLTDKDR